MNDDTELVTHHHRIIFPDGGFWIDPDHKWDGVMYAHCLTCHRIVRIEVKEPTDGG